MADFQTHATSLNPLLTNPFGWDGPALAQRNTQGRMPSQLFRRGYRSVPHGSPGDPSSQPCQALPKPQPQGTQRSPTLLPFLPRPSRGGQTLARTHAGPGCCRQTKGFRPRQPREAAAPGRSRPSITADSLPPRPEVASHRVP